MATNPHVTAANKYARDVVAGKIVACKWVIAACRRHLDDLKRQKDKAFPYKFDADRGANICEFLELLPHTKGKWARERELILLEPWQCFIFCCLFGWLQKKDNLRRFREAYIAVPRKNGKSIIAAGVGLYMFAADGEFGAEVYCGATTEKQAWEVFKPAKLMVERTPALQAALGVEVWAKSLVAPADESQFVPVIGKPGDGSSPHCAIADEYHEHDSNDLVDTMVSGMGAREQPLMLMITTSGYNIASPCYDKESDAKKMLQGVLDAPDLFAIIYSIDDDDDWTDPRVLKKANPNLGVSVNEDYLHAQLRAAKQNAALQTRYKTKNLNVWCSAKAAWMPLYAWNKCADYTLRREQFVGERCVKSLDLASRNDICALMDIFTRQMWNEKKARHETHYYVFGSYHLPEYAIESPDNRHRSAYQKWVIEGFLTQHDGTEIDFEVIAEEVEQDFKKFGYDEVIFDPWHAAQLAQDIGKKGVETVEFRNTVQNMSQPMKELFAAVIAGRLHHDGNPVLTWMMSNVVAKLDKKSNIFPDKEKTENKIDGPVAAIMALGRVMAPSESDDIDQGFVELD